MLNELNHYLYTYHGGHYLRSGSKDNSQTDADAFEYSQRNFSDDDDDATQLPDRPYNLPSYNGAEFESQPIL